MNERMECWVLTGIWDQPDLPSYLTMSESVGFVVPPSSEQVAVAALQIMRKIRDDMAASGEWIDAHFGTMEWIVSPGFLWDWLPVTPKEPHRNVTVANTIRRGGGADPVISGVVGFMLGANL